jgi:hypothetical protein
VAATKVQAGLVMDGLVIYETKAVSLLKIGVSGSHSHEALLPAGPHGPVRIISVPSPNFPVARLTHSGGNIKCVHIKLYLRTCRFGARMFGKRNQTKEESGNLIELLIFWLLIRKMDFEAESL